MKQRENRELLPTQKNKGEIVLYQPDENIRLEVRLDKETVWLTQQQIADLFGVKQPAVSKHIANIYKSGELDKNSTYSILEYMGNDGKQLYTAKAYNLDMILSVGYRVNQYPRHQIPSMGQCCSEKIPFRRICYQSAVAGFAETS
jgi:hypothetical protein